MTFLLFLCRVCSWFVHGIVQGLKSAEGPCFQEFRDFVHGVHTNARTYACRRVRACVHTHVRMHMRMHKPCTPCTHSYFSFKNNGIVILKTMLKLCTNFAQCARF